MKLEGEDRERPWDDVTITIGFWAMIACQTLAWCIVASEPLAWLVWGVSIYCNVMLMPLLRADTARVKRNNQRREQEIARIDAEMERIRKQAGDDGGH
jgi:hypothetical protein